MGLLGKMKALRLNSKASSLQEQGHLEEAESAYRTAETWPNLGGFYKVQGRWQESFEADVG